MCRCLLCYLDRRRPEGQGHSRSPAARGDGPQQVHRSPGLRVLFAGRLLNRPGVPASHRRARRGRSVVRIGCLEGNWGLSCVTVSRVADVLPVGFCLAVVFVLVARIYEVVVGRPVSLVGASAGVCSNGLWLRWCCSGRAGHGGWSVTCMASRGPACLASSAGSWVCWVWWWRSS